MNECYIDKKGNAVLSVWWRRKGVMTRRDALPKEHQESEYQCLRRLGFNPKDFGYKEICPRCGQELIQKKYQKLLKKRGTGDHHEVS